MKTLKSSILSIPHFKNTETDIDRLTIVCKKCLADNSIKEKYINISPNKNKTGKILSYTYKIDTNIIFNWSEEKCYFKVKKGAETNLVVPIELSIHNDNSQPDFNFYCYDFLNENIFIFIYRLTAYRLNHFEPSYFFGCCSKYLKCSDSKMCLHNDKLYAKGCHYKKKLDEGEIFYGKNRNIDDKGSCEIIFFDLETTGRNSKQCEIIEISALKVKDNKVIDTFSSLVKPVNPIPAQISLINHITNDMVSNASSIEIVLKSFLDFIENHTLVGHNIKSFDVPVLNRYCNELFGYSINNKIIDTLSLAKNTLNLNNYKLSTLCECFNIKNENAHRALSDCYATFECYKKMMSEPKSIMQPVDNPQKQSRRYFYKPSETTDSLQQLQVIINSIIEDQIITNDEFFTLSKWLEDNEQLSGNYPYDCIYTKVKEILKENCYNHFSFCDLLELLNYVSNPLVSDTLNNLEFFGKNFCLTGEFNTKSRSEMIEFLESKSGIYNKSVLKKTDFLIVGGLGNESWICGSYGNKIKKAKELQSKGSSIKIIMENDFLNCLKEKSNNI